MDEVKRVYISTGKRSIGTGVVTPEIYTKAINYQQQLEDTDNKWSGEYKCILPNVVEDDHGDVILKVKQEGFEYGHQSYEGWVAAITEDSYSFIPDNVFIDMMIPYYAMIDESFNYKEYLHDNDVIILEKLIEEEYDN